MTSVRSVSFAVLLSGSLVVVSGSAGAAEAVSLSDGVMLSAPVYDPQDRPLLSTSAPSVAAQVSQPPVAVQPTVPAVQAPTVQTTLKPSAPPAVALSPTVVMGVPVLAGAEKEAFARQSAASAATPVAAPVTAPVVAPVVPPVSAPVVAETQPAPSLPSAPTLDASVQPMASAPEPVSAPASTPAAAPVVPQSVAAPSASAPVAAPKAAETPRVSRLTLAATVKAITPSNYRLEFAPDVQKDLIVEAPDAGQPWSMQLDTLARAHGLRVEASQGVVYVSVAQAGMAPPDTTAANVPMTLAPVQPPVPVPPTPVSSLPKAAPAAQPAVSEAQIKLEAAPAPSPAPQSMPAPAPRPAVATTDKPAAAVLWRAARGQTLMEVLQAWSDQAGVQLYWDSKYDYPLQASLALSGSFEDAVRVILEGFDGASPQPVGKLHRQGNAGARVLIIQSRGNIYGMR